MEERKEELETTLDAIVEETVAEQAQPQEESKQEAQPEPVQQAEEEKQKEEQKIEPPPAQSPQMVLEPLELHLPAEVLKNIAEKVTEEANRKFKETTGQDYDPLLADEKQREYFNLLKENIKREIQVAHTVQIRQQRLQTIIAEIERREPKIKEIVDWLQTEAPARYQIEIKKAVEFAIERGDFSKFIEAYNTIRKDYYSRFRKEPPKVESAGTAVPGKQEAQESGVALAQKIRNARGRTDKIIELLPDDIV